MVCLREFMPVLKEENSYVIMYAFVVCSLSYKINK